MVPMIQTGCFDDFTLKSRMQCQFEYDLWMTLTAPRRKKIALMYSGQENLAMTLSDWIEENPKDKDLLDPMIRLLLKPNQSLFDSKKNLIEHEKVLLGVNITCSHVERASVPRTAVTAKDVNKSTYDRNKSFMVAGEICEYEEFKIKKGKLAGQIMANFKLDDGTDELEVVVFPSTLDEFQAALYEGNTVLVKGKRSNRGEGLILDEIYEV
jgi:DNA polymerase III alpha subunit